MQKEISYSCLEKHSKSGCYVENEWRIVIESARKNYSLRIVLIWSFSLRMPWILVCRDPSEHGHERCLPVLTPAPRPGTNLPFPLFVFHNTKYLMQLCYYLTRLKSKWPLLKENICRHTSFLACRYCLSSMRGSMVRVLPAYNLTFHTWRTLL